MAISNLFFSLFSLLIIEVIIIIIYCSNAFTSTLDISTDGIDINDWIVNPALTQELLPLEEDRLIFSCWDFAGQEVNFALLSAFISMLNFLYLLALSVFLHIYTCLQVYYTTHQFFLSQRSLYLVIFDMRHPEEELSRLEYP